jgi:hypothetical protein
MGSSTSKENIGNNLKQDKEKFIIETENYLDRLNNNFSSDDKIIIDSIKQDLKLLKTMNNNQDFLKLGILRRGLGTYKIENLLFLTDMSDSNQLITSYRNESSNLIPHNINNIDITKSLFDYYYPKIKNQNGELKIPTYFPIPTLISKNLTTFISKPLNELMPNFYGKDNFILELDIDNFNKLVLFTIINDIIIYTPSDDIENELAYLEFISENSMIVKLLRKNHLYILIDKNSCYDEGYVKNKLQNLLLRLEKTTIFEIDFKLAKEDKILFFGVMIERDESQYIDKMSYSDVKYIKNKFEIILRRRFETLKESKKKSENNSECVNEDAEYKKFRRNFIYKFGNKFQTASGIDQFEDSLITTMINLMNSKINLIKSNINLKKFLLDSIPELETNSDIFNSLIITRSEIVEEIDNCVLQLKETFDSQKNRLITECDSFVLIIDSMRALRPPDDMNRPDLINYFDIFGNISPYTQMTISLRSDYYNFNKTAFDSLSTVSNCSYNYLEALNRFVVNKYSSLFLELERKKWNIFAFNRGADCLSPEQIIKSKLGVSNMLAVYFYSLIGFTNFKLGKLFPYYCIPSICGSLISVTVLIIKRLSLNSIIGAGCVMGVSLILSKLLQKLFIKQSRDRFFLNTSLLLGFMREKKENLKSVDGIIDKFAMLYSSETLEILDLVSKVKKDV